MSACFFSINFFLPPPFFLNKLSTFLWFDIRHSLLGYTLSLSISTCFFSFNFYFAFIFIKYLIINISYGSVVWHLSKMRSADDLPSCLSGVTILPLEGSVLCRSSRSVILPAYCFIPSLCKLISSFLSDHFIFVVGWRSTFSRNSWGLYILLSCSLSVNLFLSMCLSICRTVYLYLSLLSFLLTILVYA